MTSIELFQTFWGRLGACGWRRLLVRSLVLAGGWWALTEGDPAGLAFGVSVVLLALLVSVSLSSSGVPHWNPSGLLRFVLAFLRGSLHGGLDVALRALAPTLQLSPAIVGYALRLPQGPARHLFMGALSLMPGTLVVDLKGDRLEIHVLSDGGEELVQALQHLEALVARALGEPLERSNA